MTFRQALVVATSRIVAAVTPVAALVPPRFEPMRDAQWKAIAVIVESARGRCGGRRTDLRRTVDAIRWVLQTGAQWRGLPAEYGAPTTSWRWYERWCGDGTWQQIAAALELPPAKTCWRGIDLDRRLRLRIGAPIGHDRRMRTRHVIYAGPALVGRSTSLELLVPMRRDLPTGLDRIRGSARGSLEHFDMWYRRLAGGVDITLAAGAAHICIALLYTGSNWFPSFQVARKTGHPRIRELIERAISFLPVLDGVVFVADSQPERYDANLEELESVIELLRSEGIAPTRVPFVFQLNKRDLSNVLEVDELRCTLATPRCAYVESVAVQGHGVHRALETVLEMSDSRVPAPVHDDTP